MMVKYFSASKLVIDLEFFLRKGKMGLALSRN